MAADAVHDETSAEDPEACYAGAPFVQPEHEEEWMGFVNWLGRGRGAGWRQQQLLTGQY